MSKGSEILSRVVGAGSIFGSMLFFTNIGSVHEFVLPGIFFGASGLWLVIRRVERHAALPDAESQYRLAQLAEGLAGTQQEVAAMQERLDRVNEERDFLRQLATPLRVRPAVEPPPPRDVPAAPHAPELPGAEPRPSESAPRA